MGRPTGVSVTTALMCICNAMGWFTIEWDKPRASTKFALCTVFILIGYVCIWFYRRGSNWARVVVMLTSLLTIVNLFFITRGNMVSQVVVLSEAILGIFLLWWLNTAPAREYFKSHS